MIRIGGTIGDHHILFVSNEREWVEKELGKEPTSYDCLLFSL